LIGSIISRFGFDKHRGVVILTLAFKGDEKCDYRQGDYQPKITTASLPHFLFAFFSGLKAIHFVSPFLPISIMDYLRGFRSLCKFENNQALYRQLLDRNIGT
jgi:hypothetical protein